MICEQFHSINLAYLFERNIWSLMLESTVYIKLILRGPTWVPETLHWVKLIPFRRFGIVDFHRNDFTNCVGSATYHHHEWTQEKSGMLISWNWTILAIFIWSFYPVPSSITVTAEAPGIIETTLISRSTTKADHHTCCTACLTKCSWVIHSDLWCFSSAI